MSTLLLALASTALAVPTLTLDGDCPGVVDLSAAALTAGGRVGIVAGAGAGDTAVPAGPCAGVDTGLAAPLRWFGVMNASPGGTLDLSPYVPGGVCDMSVVVLDVESCEVSAVATFGAPGAAVPGVFDAPVGGTLGGQRVFAPDGTLWYLSYGGYLASVPPGGGIATTHVHDSDVGAHGFGGTPYVDDDGTILFETGGSGTARFYPDSGTWETIADTPWDNYGVSQLFKDIHGNLVTGRPQQVIHPDLSMTEVSFLRDYVVNTPEWVYTLESTVVYRQRHDGSERSEWGSGCTDGYGLALGLSGELYCSQGNNQPAAIHRIPPEGGPAEWVGEVPSAILFVATHPVTGRVYLSGYGVGGDDVFEFDPATGESVLYGDAP